MKTKAKTIIALGTLAFLVGQNLTAYASQGKYQSPFLPAPKKQGSMHKQEMKKQAMGSTTKQTPAPTIDLSQRTGSQGVFGQKLHPAIIKSSGSAFINSQPVGMIKTLNEKDKLVANQNSAIEFNLDHIAIQMVNDAQLQLSKARRHNRQVNLGLFLNRGSIRIVPEVNRPNHDGFAGEITIQTPHGKISTQNGELVIEVSPKHTNVFSLAGGCIIKQGQHSTMLMPLEYGNMTGRDTVLIHPINKQVVSQWRKKISMTTELQQQSLIDKNSSRYEKRITRKGP